MRGERRPQAHGKRISEFVIGNSTANLKNAGLQQDEAYISIVRDGKFVATFSVDFRVTPIGGLAGMTDRSYRGAQKS